MAVKIVARIGVQAAKPDSAGLSSRLSYTYRTSTEFGNTLFMLV